MKITLIRLEYITNLYFHKLAMSWVHLVQDGDPEAGSCENCNEPSGSTICWRFFSSCGWAATLNAHYNGLIGGTGRPLSPMSAINRVEANSQKYTTGYIANTCNEHRNTKRDCINVFIVGILFILNSFLTTKTFLNASTSLVHSQILSVTSGSIIMRVYCTFKELNSSELVSCTVYYVAIKIYNQLPTSLKNLTHMKKQFKSTLKRYLLENSFYSLQEFFDTK
jgi:hypothetical protein